jgi:iron(II)-dependent oxidoreductase
VLVEGGEFLMGSTKAQIDAALEICNTFPAEYCGRDRFEWEYFQRRVNAEPFYIDKYEVTNARYAEFVEATGREAPTSDDPRWIEWIWQDARPPSGRADHPVTLVSWADAAAYCEWIGGRLPTEAEWEKAAGGTERLTWPWGSEPDRSRLNSIESGLQETVPVGSYPEGASPYGAMDMAGNVWEWTADWYGDYSEPHNPPSSAVNKVARGGAWDRNISLARTATRNRVPPWLKTATVGFRCALSVAPE